MVHNELQTGWKCVCLFISGCFLLPSWDRFNYSASRVSPEDSHSLMLDQESHSFSSLCSILADPSPDNKPHLYGRGDILASKSGS